MERWVQIGSIIQSIVVTVGLFFAAWEFVIKDREMERLQKEAVLELLLIPEPSSSKEFNYLSNHLRCKQIDSEHNWPCKDYQTAPDGLTDYEKISEIMMPVYREIHRVSLCVEVGLCDKEMSLGLFCHVVSEFANTNRLIALETGVPGGYGKPVLNMINRCEAWSESDGFIW